MAHHDLAIIGSGSGNSLVTPELADASVAVIESGAFGGTCLNVGCIPTKMFVYPADVAYAARHAARLGVDARVDGVRWREIRDRIFGRIDPISAGGEEYRRTGPGTTAYLGRARFTGPRELEVSLNDGGTQQVTADQVVVATGSTPSVPPVIRDSGVAFHTSDTVMRVEELPEHVVVVGGGYIACEFAHVFSALGARVTLLVRGDGLLTHQDAEISAAFTQVARRDWDVRLGTQVVAARPGAAPQSATLELDDGSSLEADLLLVATGRHPQTDLGLDVAGVEVGEDGLVVVDEHGRTTAEGVWALGDVCSPAQLKHVANQEARVVAHNLTHPEDLRSFDHRFIPSAVFTHPQLAAVGLTEEQARARTGESADQVVTSVQSFGDTAYGWAMEDTTSLLKLVADRGTGQLLGAHCMGPQASLLIQPLVQAMSLGTPVAGLARAQYWIHPALSEVVENAILGLGLEDPAR